MKILIQFIEASDPCGFYRTLGPYSYLAKKHPEITLNFTQRPNFFDIRAHDVLIMQRPFSTELLMSIKEARDCDVPVIIDFDDDFFSLEKDNPAYVLYNKENLKNVEAAIGMANIVTVTTEHLKRQYLKFNPNIRVIPNALDPLLIKFKQPYSPANKVLWRGTKSHDRDVATFADKIVKVAKSHEHWEFVFAGYDPVPYLCSEKIKNSSVLQFPMMVDPVYFLQNLILLKPKIIIVPLADTNFNRSKSNIAALEGCLAGAIALCPKWEGWEIPGVFNYENPDHFEELLNKMMAPMFHVEQSHLQTWEAILKHFTLDTENKARYDLLREVIKK